MTAPRSEASFWGARVSAVSPDWLTLMTSVLSLSGGGEFDEDATRARAVRLIERAYYPVGALRQGAAVLAAGDRTAGLNRLAMPALVVHGTRDPLVPFENGLRVHRAIPGSKLLRLDGVGHDVPPGEAQRVVDAIIALARGKG